MWSHTPSLSPLTSGCLSPLWVSPSSSRYQGHVSPISHSSRWDMPLGKCAARPRPSNQRRPSLLRRLLQYLKQQVAEGLRYAAVARRRQVEEVKHVLRDDGSIWVDELPAHIQVLSLAQPRQPGAQEPVNGSVLLPQWVGTLASRQQTLRTTKISDLWRSVRWDFNLNILYFSCFILKSNLS